MELIEDEALASRMLQDLGNEIKLDKPLPHLTELIYCLTRSWYDRFQPMPPTPQETLLWVGGVGLEKVLLVNHRQQRAGMKDGISYTLDYMDYNDLPGELKTTRTSAKTAGLWLSATGVPTKGKDGKIIDISKGWERQILGYLWAVESNVGTLAVLHLLGNYAPPFPQFKVWRIKAAYEELKENWDWLLARKEVYMPCVETGIPPEPFKHCMDWECAYGPCRYKLLCDARQAAYDLTGPLCSACGGPTVSGEGHIVCVVCGKERTGANQS